MTGCYSEIVVNDFTKLLNGFAKLDSEYHAIVDLLLITKEALDEFIKLCEHIHSHHAHDINTSHEVNDIIVDHLAKAYAARESLPELENLSSELFEYQDLDDNGEIYGKDFILSPSGMIPEFVYNAAYNPGFKLLQQSGVKVRSDYNSYKKEVLLNSLKTPIDEDSLGQVLSDRVLDPFKILLTEYMYDKDLDFNDKVYGKDFCLDKNDVNCPDYLKDINCSDVSDIISVDDYLEYAVQGHEQMFPQVTMLEAITIAEEEFKTGVDVNNDGFVYGRDILVVDPNMPYVLKPLIPQYLPNYVVSWNVFILMMNTFHNNSVVKDKDHYISLLKQEFETGQDLDGNTMVYGVDFIISAWERELPGASEIRFSVEQYFDTILYYNRSIKSIDLETYSPIFRQELMNRDDVDGNTYKYLTNFIISDFDEEKNQCLYEAEANRLNIIPYWDSCSLELLYNNGLTRQIKTNFNVDEFESYWFYKNNITIYEYPKQQYSIDISSLDTSNMILEWDGESFFKLHDCDDYTTFNILTNTILTHIMSHDSLKFKIISDNRPNTFVHKVPSKDIYVLDFREDIISLLEQTPYCQFYVIKDHTGNGFSQKLVEWDGETYYVYDSISMDIDWEVVRINAFIDHDVDTHSFRKKDNYIGIYPFIWMCTWDDYKLVLER
jgi:hypothetical protein